MIDSVSNIWLDILNAEDVQSFIITPIIPKTAENAIPEVSGARNVDRAASIRDVENTNAQSSLRDDGSTPRGSGDIDPSIETLEGR
jgi:hypothetical protein